MKKDKESKKKIDEEKPDAEPADTSGQQEESQAVEPDVDMEALKLGEIESTEVVPDDHVKESSDPDKQVKIKALAIQPVWWKRRWVRIAAGAAVFVLLLLAIPLTRFLLIGWAWHESAVFTVTDMVSNTPVSNATVSIGGKQATTDGGGVATVVNVPIGNHTLKIEKANYKTVEKPVTVDVFSSLQKRTETMAATGKLVTVMITDRLSGKPVIGAVVAKGAVIYGKTDTKGKVTVVVPTGSEKLDATVTIGKYNVLATTITAKTTDLQLIPSGHLYFLSKQSGKIDVIKTNLDGSDRRTVIAGTGDENDQTTTLLASRDWQYMVLKSKRAPNKPESLYIINTADDSYKVLDEGDATFALIGWAGHSFMYEVRRQTDKTWQSKTVAIKGYNAKSDRQTTLDENVSVPDPDLQGGRYEVLGNYYIVDGRLLYTKSWYGIGTANGNLAANGMQSTIVSVASDGSGRKTLKSFPSEATNDISARLYEPREVYYRIGQVADYRKALFGEVENGAYKDASAVDGFFDKTYPTYLLSPNDAMTFWSEERDGKNALFIGDKDAGNKVELASASEYKAYGWLTDDWLLVQKQNSELYITTKDQLKSGSQPLKISAYHKVGTSYVGYGSGYGGL